LVTHGIQWLPKVDNIIVLSNGKISESGTYDELLDHAGPFAEFLETYLMGTDEEDIEGMNFIGSFLCQKFLFLKITNPSALCVAY
jgi:ABC-type transporter Mla maintaining outer membrane lipid asymmetry ATPase subunit MlaF